ncbi:phosphotransferase [Thermobacillus sp.]|uniref:phosphotransferase family protein n=1 Tax=Thermobacillus sp. TaxID=2108467 RepID=UPI0025810FCC|nr:phosphotransferase [Thermobacillus sp.]
MVYSETVVSHGDFHRGNIAVSGGEIVILDWEHAHRNSPFWDLYNLFDLTHPVFCRQTSDALRQSALNAYIASRRSLGWEEPPGFIRSYYEYAAVHSVWMLLLIQDDLKQDVWEPSDLLKAQAETLASLLSPCIYSSNDHGFRYNVFILKMDVALELFSYKGAFRMK